jgi:L-arabinonolactonase
MGTEVHCVVEQVDTLGESPVWSEEEQSLYWVDIVGCRVRRFSPSSGERRDWPIPMEVGALALRASGGAVLALRSGFAFLDFDSGNLTSLVDPEEDLPNNRFNDGACDRMGRFWAGTLHDAEVEPLGSLYRLDADFSCTKMVSAVIISNGLGWSPDNRTMYFTDSGLGKIDAFDYDLATGNISQRRTFAKVNPEDGIPDGLAVDSEGYVWAALWDGWSIRRYAADGSLDRVLELPAQRPTSCAFGGPDLATLFVTSAADGLGVAELQAGPLAGSVFALEPGVRGLPEPLFAG